MRRLRGNTSRVRETILGAMFVLVGVVTAIVIAGWLVSDRLMQSGRVTKFEFKPDRVLIVSFDPQTRLGTRIELPVNLEIEGVDGQAKWMVTKLPEVERKLHKVGWASKSLSQYLGVAETWEQSGVAVWDIWVWSRLARDIVWQDVNMVDLEIVTPQTSIDGVDYYVIGPRWETYAHKWLVDSELQQEGIGVQIVNTTGRVGMGTRAGRVLETSGIKVEEIKTSDTAIDDCMVVVGEGGESWSTTKFVLKNFGCMVQVDESQGRSLKLSLGKQYETEWLGEE